MLRLLFALVIPFALIACTKSKKAIHAAYGTPTKWDINYESTLWSKMAFSTG
jgi:hypothetical protein